MVARPVRVEQRDRIAVVELLNFSEKRLETRFARFQGGLCGYRCWIRRGRHLFSEEPGHCLGRGIIPRGDSRNANLQPLFEIGAKLHRRNRIETILGKWTVSVRVALRKA